MPKPHKGESRNDFISRCISYLSHKGEGKSQDQRVAICHSYADKHYGENEEVKEEARSVAQQHLMGMVYSMRKKGMSPEEIYNKVEKDAGKSAAKKAKQVAQMSMSDLKDYAETEHKGLPKQVKEGSIKSLIEGMTFSSFLIVEQMPEADTSTVRGFIRSLPQWQEMMQDENAKPQALKLARSMMQEFGDDPLDQNVKDYIFDRFDDLSSQYYKGSMVGDWKGEEEYQKRQRAQQEIDDVADEIAPKQRRRGGARVGMDYAAGRKAAKAQADFSQANPRQQAARLAQARSRAQEAGAPQRGSKVGAAREIFSEMYGEARPSEIIRRMMDEVGMSKPHATTYYYKFKKAAQ